MAAPGETSVSGWWMTPLMEMHMLTGRYRTLDRMQFDLTNIFGPVNSTEDIYLSYRALLLFIVIRM